MVASYLSATGARRAGESSTERPGKRSNVNCGPMMQQGTMGAHGHEMHPQGFLRLIGCHETNRQKEDAPPRLHA